MQPIIIASEKLKLHSELCRLCEFVGYTNAWRDTFWEDLLQEEGIYKEFLYYMEHQDFLDEYKVEGMGVLDIFVWQMRKFNLRLDRGKNGEECDKMAMLLETFRYMIDMKRGAGENPAGEATGESDRRGAYKSPTWSMEMRNGMDEL